MSSTEERIIAIRTFAVMLTYVATAIKDTEHSERMIDASFALHDCASAKKILDQVKIKETDE